MDFKHRGIRDFSINDRTIKEWELLMNSSCLIWTLQLDPLTHYSEQSSASKTSEAILMKDTVSSYIHAVFLNSCLICLCGHTGHFTVNLWDPITRCLTTELIPMCQLWLSYMRCSVPNCNGWLEGMSLHSDKRLYSCVSETRLKYSQLPVYR